ncbi:MAG: hypothetical protein IJA32_10940 [Lachnospiraceae bacterium]|nr:hypothetical protein [Lachnospiraceae bacterium]
MKDKTFYRVIQIILLLGMISTTALVIYTIYLRNHCSIITYIANEA